MKAKFILTVLLGLISPIPVEGCTIFSIEQNEHVYVGNNEDWCNPSTRYHVIPGEEEHYGRIFFSFDNNWGQGGMNEKGLFYDWIFQSGEGTNWKRDPMKKNFSGNLSEKILAECASVEEALKYYEAYNEPDFNTSLIVLVDTSGQSAYVFWDNNELTIQKCKGLCVSGYGSNKVAEKFKKKDGLINKKERKDLLNIAHQEGNYPTLYSNLYDLKKGQVHLYYYHNFEEEIVLDLKEELKKGKHSMELKDLFRAQIPKKEFDQLQKEYLRREGKNIFLAGWLALAGFASMIFLIFYAIFQLKRKSSEFR